MNAAGRLRTIRLLHTAVWAVFAGCIIAIPACVRLGRLGPAAVLAIIVFGEVVVLWLNGWKCPLTAVAARYTEDRRPNFDIYLPLWLARYNQQIFGTLYLGSVAYLMVEWLWGPTSS